MSRISLEAESILLPMIEDRIQKARKAYFQFGSIYAFQGSLSPVSTSSIVQWCVLPILLYGVENCPGSCLTNPSKSSSAFGVRLQNEFY